MVESTSAALAYAYPTSHLCRLDVQRITQDLRPSRRSWPSSTPPEVSHFPLDAFSLLEQLLFSDKVKKINMFGWNQERILAVTTEHIYNLKKGKPKRKIPVNLLGGVSKTVGANKTEFTIHVPT